MLIAYATHGNILHARGCTIFSTNVPDNSGTIACGILLRGVFSGMQAVKWLNGPIMKQNEAYRAIFCTLKTTSGFIFLLPVV